jgi:hypothetical protein
VVLQIPVIPPCLNVSKILGPEVGVVLETSTTCVCVWCLLLGNLVDKGSTGKGGGEVDKIRDVDVIAAHERQVLGEGWGYCLRTVTKCTAFRTGAFQHLLKSNPQHTIHFINARNSTLKM